MSFPTEEQAAVIAHRGKPLVVVAGPGSGKTRTLVERMISLLAEDASREVSFITFTRTSRRDTGRRLDSAFGDAIFQQPHIIFPRTSTLHTYAKSLVHRYANTIERRSDFSVLIDNKGEKALLLNELNHDLDLPFDLDTLSKDISCYRCTGQWPEPFSMPPSDQMRVLDYFETLLAFYNAFDMEGIVVAACRILDSGAINLPPLFLQVDEYQDLNPIDQRLVQLAASNPLSQVVVVGDDAQSIYGFRHANYHGLRTLWESPSWQRIPFPDSHRLPPHILNAALDLIANQGYLGAALNRKPPDGKRIPTYQCTTSDLQLRAVANYIRQTIAKSTDRDEPPVHFKDFLILCPTTAFVDTTVQHLNERYGIPAHKPTASSIPEAYWRLLLVLRMAHNNDPLALRQWLPILGFSEGEIQSLRSEAMQSGIGLYPLCITQDNTRFKNLFMQLNDLAQARNNLASFRLALEAFQHLPPQEEFLNHLVAHLPEDNSPIPSFGRLIQLIYEMFGLIDAGEEAEMPEEDKVNVATLHSAKGVEAEYVCCMWMNARFMPMANRDIEEERRVLYVALTRAKREVVLTFFEEYDRVNNRRLFYEALSPFLREILPHLKIIRIRSKDLP